MYNQLVSNRLSNSELIDNLVLGFDSSATFGCRTIDRLSDQMHSQGPLLNALPQLVTELLTERMFSFLAADCLINCWADQTPSSVVFSNQCD